jgi:hypothetical protein
MECAHTMCTCLVTDGQEYCSPSCATGVEGLDKCFCGHPECQGT